MSSKVLSLVSKRASVQRAAPVGQMYRSNAFEGRGRAVRHRVGALSARSVTFASLPDRDAFMAAWSRFVRLTTRDRDHAAKVYGKTFQTACNWYDGVSIPTGDVVAHGFALHSALATRLLAGGR